MTHGLKRSVDKGLLSNILRHHDVHNRVREERDTWRLYQIDKQRLHQLKKRERERRRRSYSDSPRLSRDTQKRNSPSFFWTRQLMEIELNDPDRWGHSGYKDMYPEEFDTKPQPTDKHDISTHKTRKRKQHDTKSSSRKKKKKKEKKRTKTKKKKVKKQATKSDSSMSDDSTDNDSNSDYKISEQIQSKELMRKRREGHMQQSNSSSDSDVSSDVEYTEKGSHCEYDTKKSDDYVMCDEDGVTSTWRTGSRRSYYSDSDRGGGKKTRWKT